MSAANPGHDEITVDSEPVHREIKEAHMTAVSKHSLVNPRVRHGLRLRTCSITAVGSYQPERVMTNAELGKGFGDDGEWILSSTGIRQRCLLNRRKTNQLGGLRWRGDRPAARPVAQGSPMVVWSKEQRGEAKEIQRIGLQGRRSAKIDLNAYFS